MLQSSSSLWKPSLVSLVHPEKAGSCSVSFRRVLSSNQKSPSPPPGDHKGPPVLSTPPLRNAGLGFWLMPVDCSLLSPWAHSLGSGYNPRRVSLSGGGDASL